MYLNYFRNLINNVVKEEKEQHDTKGAATSKDKTKESNKSKKDTTQTTKEKEEDIDLSTLFKKMKEEKMKLNRDLVTARKYDIY